MPNVNAIHNILNLLGIIVASLLTFDWAGLGLDPATVGTISVAFIWADKIIKLALNLFRDGLGGLFKVQPPVA